MSAHVDLSAFGIDQTLKLADEHAERAAIGECSPEIAQVYALTSIALPLSAIGRQLRRNEENGLGLWAT